jgi:hypothetical protein
MATRQRSGSLVGSIGSFLEAGYEHDSGDRVAVELDGDIYAAEVRAREAPSAAVQAFLREGPPKYEVKLIEQEIEADANVQNDYEIEVSVEESVESSGYEIVSEDDIL